ncbi:hypothetical protein JCM21900_006270 [Sporobolomyces salmonicolor]
MSSPPASVDAEMSAGRANVASRLPIPTPRPSFHPMVSPAAHSTPATISSFRKLVLSDKSNLARLSKPASTGPSRPSQLATTPPRVSTTLHHTASQPPPAARQPSFSPRCDKKRGSSLTVQRGSTLAVGSPGTSLGLQVYNDASGSLRPPPPPRTSPQPSLTTRHSRTNHALAPLPRSPAQTSPRFRQFFLPSFSRSRARSISPARAGSQDSHPVFRFTITQFDNSPVASPSFLKTQRVAMEDEGAGMDSSIVLETYEEGQVTPDEEFWLADETHETQEGAVEEVAPGEADPNTVVEAMDGADHNYQLRLMPNILDSTAGPFNETAPPSTHVTATATFDELPHQALPSGSLYLPSPPARLKARRGAPPPSNPSIYSATFMPPRRPRSVLSAASSSASAPAQPASSEDDLAYLIRTTGTYSSEDDLPLASSASLSSDERQFQLAEREVGRAMKPSSGQREKRGALAAAKDRAGVRGLKIGKGRGGRRRGWRREVLSQRTGGERESEGEERTSEDELWLRGAQAGS